MLTNFAKYFLIFIYGNIISPEALELGTLLNLFEYCAVHIYNYRGLTISPLNKPVTLYLNMPFEIEAEIRNYEIIRPVQCQAAIYILPKRSNIAPPKNDAGYYSSRIPMRKTYIRYDVLVDDPKRKSLKIWNPAYNQFLQQSLVTSYGLITETDASFSNLSDKLKIINIFKVSYKSSFVTTSTSLNQLSSNKLYYIIKDVHDIQKNTHVQWTLSIQPDDSMIRNYHNLENVLGPNIERIHNMFKTGIVSPAHSKIVQPTQVSEEGIENFLFAFILLGADVNLTNPSEYYMRSGYTINPSITFDVPHGTVMMEPKPRQSAYVSCSPVGGPKFHKFSFQESAMYLISIFELRIYYALIVTYVAPPILLGLLYHFILKKNIKKEYWVSWHPFGWGIRALIWQAGDRKFNSARFGWTIFMVVPWLLVAIIISYVFRQHVLYVMGKGGYLDYPWNVLKIQYNSGVTLVTDNEILARELNTREYVQSYSIMARKIARNRSITYISWEDRVKSVAKLIGNRCPYSWQPVKFGRVDFWDLSFISRYAGYGLRAEPRGWVIEQVIDNSIFGRLSNLDGESGIFGKWREYFKRANDYKAIRNRRGWIVPLSMHANMLYLFYCWGTGFGVALIIWIIEWIFFKVYTEPRRKWMRKVNNARKIIVSGMEEEMRDSGRGSINSGGGIEDGVVNEAVLLVNEQIRSAEGCKAEDEVEGEQIKGGNVDEAFVEGMVTEVDGVEMNIENGIILVKEDFVEESDDMEVQKNIQTGELDKLSDLENRDIIELEKTVTAETFINVARSESGVSFAEILETVIGPRVEAEMVSKNSLDIGDCNFNKIPDDF